MKRLVVALTFVALVAALFTLTIYAEPVGYKLMAGQSMWVGHVEVDDDGDDLTVTYQTYAGWCLNETHVHVADDLSDIPQKNGNPIPGHFDYKGDHDCVNTVTYTIPLDWGDGPPLYIAAHAVVGSRDDPGFDETGWGVFCGQMETFGFPGRNWAVYIEYPLPPGP